MSITDDDGLYDDGDRNPSDIKSLRRKADKSDRLEAELEQTRRELAFTRAGINIEDPKMRYFAKGYEGELDPSQIRQAAVEAGFLAAEQPDPGQQQQIAAEQQIARTVSGAQPQYDGDGALIGLEKAMEEGGIEAMMQFGQQYGLRISNP